jgi:hypothetical protein
MENQQFNKLFHHHLAHRVIICKECAFAIPPDHFAGHVKKHHRVLPPGVREAIIKQLAQITDVARTPEELVLPAPGERAVEFISIHEDGRKCTFTQTDGQPCQFISRGALQNMKRHCRIEHGWLNPDKKGGQRRIVEEDRPSKPWRENVHCQTIFRAPGWKKLIEVRTTELDAVDAVDLVKKQLEKQLEEAKKKKQELRRAELINAEQDMSRFEGDGWLEKTRWAVMLDGRNREWLQTLVEVVDLTKEGKLARICRSVRRVIAQAQRDSQAEVVGPTALEVINRTEFGGDDDRRSGKPMLVK